MMSVAGSNTDEEGVKAIRILGVMQAKEIIERHLRNEFTDFYKGEISKARKMGMQLSKEQIDEKTGKPTIKANETFLKVVHQYFTDKKADRTIDQRQSNPTRRVVVDNIEEDETPQQSDSDASQTSYYIISGSSQKKAQTIRKTVKMNSREMEALDSGIKVSSFAKSVSPGQKGRSNNKNKKMKVSNTLILGLR